MATNKWSFIFLLATVAALATSASAKVVFIVGDDKGWTLNFDYQAWAYGKKFVVGDKLVFKYGVGKHNVFRVNGSVFQQCMIPPTIEALTSGYDVITLTTPGRKWYICGVGKHCVLGGLKIFINGLPQPMPPVSLVSPPPPSVFRYPMGKHNVFRVNGISFQQCTIPFANEALTTGYDVITLVTPGRKWYICGVGKHREMSLKLFINVLPLSTYPPPPYHEIRKLAPPKF
ncbi:hypothetical protein OSB04_010702 [Centaurea solstitialis]|uniref:Phytocyanin domain-containing protein n=1 Tax=Centaurea solstitialis TaxID=347529 RepID=A0AA38TSU9_9ASTR|nr:hypothetical protein OSB04_010702 [Centaurea solstitialis]